MHPMFATHMLSEQGKAKAQEIAEQFDGLHMAVSAILGAQSSREFSLCCTKLEEACFFAKKAMATQPGNQQ